MSSEAVQFHTTHRDTPGVVRLLFHRFISHALESRGAAVCHQTLTLPLASLDQFNQRGFNGEASIRNTCAYSQRLSFSDVRCSKVFNPEFNSEGVLGSAEGAQRREGASSCGQNKGQEVK